VNIAELAAIAVGIALNPPAVVAVIVLLSSPDAPRPALAFLGGWVAGLVAVAGLVLLAGDVGAMAGDTGPWLLGVKLLIGVGLVAAAIAKWVKSRAATGPKEMPGWMSSLQGFSAGKTFWASAAFAGLNPKTLALNVAGVVLILEAETSVTVQLAALAGFVALASATVAAPVVYQLVARERSEAVLARTQTWLVDNAALVTAGVLGVLGAIVTADAVTGLLALV